MGDRSDPLRTHRLTRADGLTVARQAPPSSAASFSATYVAPAGWAYDPEPLEGLSMLTGQLVTSGAGRRDRIALARELDRRGGTLQTHCHPESLEVALWGPVDSFGPLMDLFADVVLAPRLLNSDLERVRRQAEERRLRELTQPDSRAERELYRGVFPVGHPYRLTGTGTHDSIRRIRRRDIVRFHAEHFTSEGSIVAVTAPVSLERVRWEVDRRFHGFHRTRAPARPPIPPGRRNGRGLRRVPMSGRAQVEIRIGGESVARTSEWYPAAFLANEVLGGRPLLSRLFQRVREQQGLAYHASSDIEPMRWGGYWTVQAGTGPERVDRVLPILTAELRRIRADLTPARELDRVRRSLIGELPLALETTRGAHELLVDVAYHDLPGDFYRTWPTTLRALRASDVRRGAQEALDGGRSTTIVTGPTAVPPD